MAANIGKNNTPFTGQSTGDLPPVDQAPTTSTHSNERTTSAKPVNPLASKHAPPITVAEKDALIYQYAKLFGKHMETKFPDYLKRMVALSLHIEQEAQSGKYSSINALHDDYNMLYETYLTHTPDLVLKVGMELSQFAVVQNRWWPQCRALPDQEERLKLVKAVVKSVIDNCKASPNQLWAAMKELVNAARGEVCAEDSDDGLIEGVRHGLGHGIGT